MKSYVFRVVIEEDQFENGQPAFHAYCPLLQGARSWGHTREEALQNIQQVVKMIVDEMIEEGKDIPPDFEIESPAVLVTV